MQCSTHLLELHSNLIGNLIGYRCEVFRVELRLESEAV